MMSSLGSLIPIKDAHISVILELGTYISYFNNVFQAAVTDGCDRTVGNLLYTVSLYLFLNLDSSGFGVSQFFDINIFSFLYPFDAVL